MNKNITIETTNDGGLSNPAPLLYSASNVPLNDGDTVPRWFDSSPLGNDALKVGNPIFKQSIINGKPVVRLNGTTDGFNLTNLISGASPWTMILVAAKTGAMLWSLTSDNNQGSAFCLVSGADYYWNQGNLGYTAEYFWGSGFHIYTVKSVSDAAVPQLYVAGVPRGNEGGNPASQLINFGTFGYRPFDSNFGASDFAELIFFNTANETDRVNAETTMSVKYGITYGTVPGSVIDIATLAGLQGWWKADALL